MLLCINRFLNHIQVYLQKEQYRLFELKKDLINQQMNTTEQHLPSSEKKDRDLIANSYQFLSTLIYYSR